MLETGMNWRDLLCFDKRKRKYVVLNEMRRETAINYLASVSFYLK